MNYDVKIEFDLSKQRPQVLLIGNGLLRQPDNDDNWNKFILKLSDTKIDTKTQSCICLNDKIPNSIKSNVLLPIEDVARREKYNHFLTFPREETEFYNYDKNKYNKNLQLILDVNCDAILTTNYTYELENLLLKDYYLKSERKKREFACFTTKSARNEKISERLSVFNRFYYKNKNKDIWHIHGEARKKSSLIFTHDEYSRLICDIVNYNKNNGNRYLNFRESLRIKSWTDFFVIADLYILGFGLDFSEFDLWWLLNRRLREKSGHGEIHFFEPKKSNQKSVKNTLLECFDIEVHNCNVSFEENANLDYKIFYEKAIKEINEIISKKRKENQNEKNF